VVGGGFLFRKGKKRRGRRWSDVLRGEEKKRRRAAKGECQNRLENGGHENHFVERAFFRERMWRGRGGPIRSPALPSGSASVRIRDSYSKDTVSY